MSASDPTAPRIPLAAALTSALAALRLDGVLDVSWLTICAPLWLPWLLVIAWAFASGAIAEIRAQSLARGRPS